MMSKKDFLKNKKWPITFTVALILMIIPISSITAYSSYTNNVKFNSVNMSFDTVNDISILGKRELYEKYQAAVKEAMEKYDAKIELKPFEKFDFTIAEPIDEFKIILRDIGESKWHNPKSRLITSNALTLKEYEEKVKEKKLKPQSFQEETHTDTVTVGGKSITIQIVGQFETYYSDYHKRQLISVSSYISGISSTTSSYTWSTNYLDESVIDSGRTYYVSAQGYVEHDNMTWYNLEVSTYFYCNSVGDVY